MKKIFKYFSIFFILGIFIPSIANAAIRFITDETNVYSEKVTKKYKSCPERGYTLTTCPPKKIGKDFCYATKRYFKTCVCDPSIFKFNGENCKNKLEGDQCDGNYEICGCSKEFQYNKRNCERPKTLTGEKCNDYYNSCSCPSKYSEKCDYPYIGEGEECDGNFVRCTCSGAFRVCDDAPADNAIKCTEINGTVKYSSCAPFPSERCIDYGYYSSVPVFYKCKEIKIDGTTCYKDCYKAKR